jgi:amidohydrolase
MENLRQLVNEQKDRIIKMRRDLHRMPETAYTEMKTSAYVADYLNNLRLEVQTGIARYGVVGLLKTDRPGPTLMIRADMDALPLIEDTGLDFASEHASTKSKMNSRAISSFYSNRLKKDPVGPSP